jgi:hypothetical protein
MALLFGYTVLLTEWRTQEMRVARGRVKDLPPRRKQRSDAGTSEAENLPGWPVLRKEIEAGIPKGQDVWLEVSNAEMTRAGNITPRKIRWFFNRYLELHGHRERGYRVKVRATPNGYAFYVANPRA